MFFPEKITLIGQKDRVLEIGPGGSPYRRADLFLELRYDDENEGKLQRGNTEKLRTDKPIIYYDGIDFPFNDKEFDYVICSHVIEHVENIEYFLSEMFRIASKGYIEYPTIYYEYLYNFSVHLNFLKFKDGNLIYLKKTKTCINEFSPIQSLFCSSLEKGHKKLIDDLRYFMFEGFEWSSPFPVREAKRIQELALDKYDLPNYSEQECNLKRLLGSIINKVTFIKYPE